MTTYQRKDWGAVPATPGPGRLNPADVVGIALHWPGMATPRHTRAEVAQSLRAWQRFHMGTHGWSDIAYQEAVDQAGNVWVLRGLTTQSGANGNRALNEAYGALLLVLAPGETPSKAMVEAVQSRVAAFRRLYPHATRVVGHGAIRPDPTACPGPAVNRLLAAHAFTPPAHVHNHVTDAREDLDKARDLLTSAAGALAKTPASRKVAHQGADRARAIRADITALLERLPLS